jgi:hypothetical protein
VIERGEHVGDSSAVRVVELAAKMLKANKPRRSRHSHVPVCIYVNK